MRTDVIRGQDRRAGSQKMMWKQRGRIDHMRWSARLPDLMAYLSARGLVVIVKVDGERDRLPWTVVISGQPMQGTAIRVDGPTLDHCIDASLSDLRAVLPQLELPTP
jgi:hypothetical protein